MNQLQKQELEALAGLESGDRRREELEKAPSWEALRQFSPLRANLLDWYPFTGEEAVLEFGSGCGALSGFLAQRVKRLTCVEGDREMREIAGKRKELMELPDGRISLLGGSWAGDIRPQLDHAYDMIAAVDGLAGADRLGFSTAEELAGELASLLGEDGILLLAVPNPLGMRYLAGCREENSGRFFDGPEGYPQCGLKPGMSRKELEELAKRAGLLAVRFFYPYPDLRFTQSLYSDGWLPKEQELGGRYLDFAHDRLALFSEERAYGTAIRAGIYAQVANSYLMAAARTERGLRRVAPLLYCRHSNERDPRFAIRTEIREEGGIRSVRKLPADASAKGHVAALPEWEEQLNTCFSLLQEIPLLSGFTVKANRCREEGDGSVSFAFLEGQTLHDELKGLLDAGKTEKLEDIFSRYIAVLYGCADRPFAVTPEFSGIFGNIGPNMRKAAEDWLCLRVSDIDLIFENIIAKEGCWNLLDYEWTFDFPVPVKFIVYRAFHYFLHELGENRMLHDLDLFGMAGISQDEQRCFAGMEESFQRYIQGRTVPLRELYERISPGCVTLDELTADLRADQYAAQLYRDFGSGISAGELEYPACDDGELGDALGIVKEFTRKITVELKGGERQLRIDPCSCRCLIRGMRAYGEDGAEKALRHNGHELGGPGIYFSTDDPQIWVVLEQADPGEKFTLEADISCETGELEEAAWQAHDRMAEENALLKERLRQMEETRVWKAYMKYQKVTKRS